MEFDKVTLAQPGALPQILTPELFYAIPLEKRIDLLCKGFFTFLKDGKPVSPLAALKKPGS